MSTITVGEYSEKFGLEMRLFMPGDFCTSLGVEFSDRTFTRRLSVHYSGPFLHDMLEFRAYHTDATATQCCRGVGSGGNALNSHQGTSLLKTSLRARSGYERLYSITRRAGEQRNKIAQIHSITMSAVEISAGGTVMPQIGSVLRLMTVSNRSVA